MNRLSLLILLFATLQFGKSSKGIPPSTTIIGGRKATQGEIPYILSLQQTRHGCGASLIEVNGTVLAISAAHCTYSFENYPQNLTLVAGELNLSNNSGLEQVLKVSKVVNHNWDQLTNENDISLLFLDNPVHFNDNVQVIALPPAGKISSGSVQVSGWGLISESGDMTDDLMTADAIPIVNHTDCNRAYQASGWTITENMLCAGILGTGGVDACQMDSGGPAVQNGKLVGIVSFGLGCARPEYPGVYTEVSFFLDWIHHNVATYVKNNVS